MAAQTSSPTKLFTVAEANAALPLVRVIVRDLVNASRELRDRREHLDTLLSGRRLASGNPYDDELAQMEEDLDRDAARIREYIGELHELGVEPKSTIDGVVDFPGYVDGNLVYLCWTLGEETVAYWHELDSGDESRMLLPSAGTG